MSSSIHVAELPKELLEDTPVDYENWKIPRAEEMQEILNGQRKRCFYK